MTELAERWGIIPRYTSFRGDVVESPASSVDEIMRAMADGQVAPPAETAHNIDPGRCADPPERAWGWAVQLYAVRSKQSWGIGDLGDLRRLARWARRTGASVVQVSPLGAQPPTTPQQFCPYYASSRRFMNPTYLRVEDVGGADRVAGELAPLQAKGLALNAERLIDHDAVFTLKTQALELIFRAAPAPKGMATWQKKQGQALVDFANFNVDREVAPAGWSRSERIAFHQWLQFHLHRQLARAAREISLINDIPVGFASDGFDAWRWQKFLVPGVRVGAPPDYFFPDGQDWGQPPFDPWKLHAVDFEPFIDAVRTATAHGAGVRLDHVMSLFRLFWIPEAGGAAAGAYVRYPATELLAVLAAESRSSGAFVIGEDLGLVEPAVKTALRQIGALGYRLLWFETEAPEEWPQQSVAAIGTHDLPTVSGIWRRSEPDQRQHHLRSRLVEATSLPDDADPIDVAVSAYRRLARSKSSIVLASLEDALAVDERPNVPGTTTEWPNWRLALPLPLEDIETAAGPRRIADVMAAANRSSHRAS